ncbi:MAG: hypothetical protein M1383_05370 [Patescibacteria group bacterium]|nr:hypothetical protein [Patescibacteria group bacterium]
MLLRVSLVKDKNGTYYLWMSFPKYKNAPAQETAIISHTAHMDPENSQEILEGLVKKVKEEAARQGITQIVGLE